MPDLPAYFLTWTTYGTWLHGDKRGSVDDQHNQRHTRLVEANTAKQTANAQTMKHASIVLDETMRRSVDTAIRRVCDRRSWEIHALNVRSNHVHIVLSASTHKPEQVMGQLKSWSTRDLISQNLHPQGARCWTKMGSTRWINDQNSLTAAVDYVLNHQ